jgi:GWxTD domain-containing protein
MMKRNYLKWGMGVVLFSLLCISLVHIQAKEPVSFPIGLDFASFREFADSTQSYVEIYYAFNRRALEFVPQKEGLIATVLMQLSISDEQGNEVESRMWNTLSGVKDMEEAEKTDYMIIDQVGTNLKPGKYRINLKATDVNCMSAGEASIDAEVKEFSTSKLQLSDLELAFTIEADTSRGRLTKAGQKIRPNPSRIFTHESGMVYFYAELYNLAYTPKAKPEYELNFKVLNTEGKQIKDFGKRTKAKPGNSSVVISGINVATFEAGDYVLQIEAKDKETGKKVLSAKNFKVYREKTEEELMAEQIKRFKQDVAYIASTGELDIFGDLNYTGKQTFMEEFWRKRDPDPQTPENEFKIEHYRRLNYANYYFSRTKEANDGWNTDMGRIYIIYGEPSEIERNVSTRGTAPWERWNYFDLEGGTYFIFVDEDGYGVYRLVHSNHKGEIYDSDWEERIKSGSASD